MRLKSFYAKTMTEAMNMVRETLGEDAIIVATREENGGKAVRVTAAIEQSESYDDDRPHIHSEKIAEQYEEDYSWDMYEDETGDEEAVIEKLTDAMLRHAVPEEITDQIISCATVVGLEQPDIALIAALEHLFSFRPLPRKNAAKALMMVGPPGAGKTLATAKLAARSVMNGKRVAVISTDTIRAGGVEQLEGFTKLLRIRLQKADNTRQLAQCLADAKNADQIYIDTGGMNPFAPEEMREIARLMTAGPIDPVLIMPAGTDTQESGEISRVYGTLGVRYMLPTRLDIARRLGGLLSAAHYGGMVFTDASHTHKVADGLIPLSPKKMAQLLMPPSGREKRDSLGIKRKKQIVSAG